MFSPTLRRLPPLAVAVLAAAVLLADGALVAARAGSGDSHPAATPSTPTTSPPTTTPSGSATPTTAPRPGTQAALVAQIGDQVAQLRGLQWHTPVAVDIVPKPELVRRLRALDARDRHADRDAGDGATYKLLHLIPRDVDYARALDDLNQGVGGVYDPETKRLTVAEAAGGDVDPATRVAIAHELDHALTDQWFGFGARLDQLDRSDQPEALMGLLSLVEGDAVLLQDRWSQAHLSDEEQIVAAFGGADGADLSAIQRVPRFLLDQLLFLYTSGQDFVKALVGPRGLTALNDAYGRPPTSTEQILHPDRYLAHQGWSRPDLPDVASSTGCQAVRSSTLGEFAMEQVLETDLSPDAAKADAAGWNGDAFQVVRCGGASGMAERWVADTDADAARLQRGLQEWARGWSSGGTPAADGRFSGTAGSGRLTRSGTRVDLVLADNPATADRVSAAAG